MVDLPSQILSGNLALGYETGWDDSEAVTVTRMSNGATQTNINRPPLRKMFFRSAMVTDAQAKTLEEFKRTVGGRAKSFLFLDYGHYILTNHEFYTATGGEDTVQLKEVFGDYSWTIRHVVSGSLTLYVDGVEFSSSLYTESSGLITFTGGSPSPLLAGEVVSATLQFYTPVRFSTAYSSRTMMLSHSQVQNLDLEEALGE